MANQWLTMAEYARRAGLARSTILEAVRTGRLEYNKKTGRACRVRGPLAQRTDNAAPLPDSGANDQDSLSRAKLEKMRADIELQKQKIAENRDAMRREFAEAVIEEYAQAFAPVKARLTEMRLRADQLSALRKLIASCTAVFESNLRKRLIENE